MTSGREEVWDFMRLDMGQGAVDLSVGLSEINRRSASRSMLGNIPQNASNVPKIPQNEPKMSKMQVNCEKPPPLRPPSPTRKGPPIPYP